MSAERPPEMLKSFANRLALSMSDDDMQLLRRLHVAGLLGENASQTSAKGNGNHKPGPELHRSAHDRVGIWERRQENGKSCFIRSMEMQKEWNLWANVGRIETKGTKWRIVLIGESVARGFLYDPQFNPAMMLDAILQSQLGKEKVEVVDLARTNLTADVKELALSALLLEPDAVIIFSGNNSLWNLSPALLPAIDTALCNQGVPGLKRLVENQVAEAVQKLVEVVASTYRSRQVPLIWMVPEFNLGDWSDVLSNAPHLRENTNQKWIDCRQQADTALQNGDLATASRLAAELVDLDGGTNPTGFRIMAECHNQAGDREKRRACLELARDSLIWDSSYAVSPRSLSVVQNALREEARRHGNYVVDLPAIFAEYLNGGLPDRKLFLDYCHLTIEGMQVAMAAAASDVLQSVAHLDHCWQDLMTAGTSPSQQVKAEAAFLAAIHNAHYNQPYDLVFYYCLQAIQTAPRIAQVMMCFVELQTLRTPMMMSRAAEKISTLGSPLIQYYLLGYTAQQLDRVLLAAIVAAIKKVAANASKKLLQLRTSESATAPPSQKSLDHYEAVVASLGAISVEVEEKLGQLRQPHSVANHDVDLLEYYYCSASLQPQEIMWVTPKYEQTAQDKRSQYYKAYWKESKFVFVDGPDCSVRLTLTCRLPKSHQTSKSATAAIKVNGKHVGEIALRDMWTTWDITAPASVIQSGLNEVVIFWPTPEFKAEQALTSAVNDLMQYLFPELYCVFGEIFSFVACRADKNSPTTPKCYD